MSDIIDPRQLPFFRSAYGPWQRWFAWYPVRTDQHGWRWLRTVERALYYPPDVPFAPSPYWVYRPTSDNRHDATDQVEEQQ